MKRTVVWTSALLAAFALAACDPNMRSPTVTRVDPKTGEVKTISDVREFEAGILKSFPDIPIPATHKVNMERTTIFTSNAQSLGKIVVEGNGDGYSLFEFYQNAMKEQGWSLVNAFQSETSSLYYAKPGKFVAIIIETTGRLGSRVTLNIGPE